MTRMKVFIVMVAFGLAAMLMAGVNTVSAAPATEQETKEYIAKAFQGYAQLKSYHMSVDSRASFTVQGRSFNVVTRGEFDINNKPIVMKNVMTITMEGLPQKNEQKFEQYIEEAGDKFIAYSKVNNQWVKQELPGYKPLSDYENYFKAFKQVTLVKDAADSTVYDIVIDGSYIQENLQKAMGTGAKQVVPVEIFKELGDFKYTITIDKKAAAVTKMEMDLSEMFAVIGEKIAEAIPQSQNAPEGQAAVTDMLKNMKLVTTITLSQFNGVGKVTIPQEALKAPMQKAPAM